VNDTEQLAQRIAGRGREALLTRLRPAFEEAAAAHADVLELDPAQLEEMVQRAADRADGLQWRRALAAVASEELGIGLGEALGHPAVERAQEIVGAPSYEESLAKLGPLSEAVQEREAPAAPEQATPPAQEPPDEPVSQANGNAPVAGEPDSLRLSAVHLGGIANLAPSESDIQLEFSQHGLDVIRGSNTILGRLGWEDIRALEVPDPRGWRRRRRAQSGQLVVRTDHGDASFEIPGLGSGDLRDQLEPVRKYMVVKS
jgi:hypothetical protein